MITGREDATQYSNSSNTVQIKNAHGSAFIFLESKAPVLTFDKEGEGATISRCGQ